LVIDPQAHANYLALVQGVGECWSINGLQGVGELRHAAQDALDYFHQFVNAGWIGENAIENADGKGIIDKTAREPSGQTHFKTSGNMGLQRELLAVRSPFIQVVFRTFQGDFKGSKRENCGKTALFGPSSVQ
jgi:hypothetical protein